MLVSSMTREEISAWAASRETSLPIARAILARSVDAAMAQRIWSDPEQCEIEEIMDQAWVNADEDTHEMQWGEETMTDEGHAR